MCYEVVSISAYSIVSPWFLLTGALGLMMTLGGRIPWRAAGVPGACIGAVTPRANLSGVL